MPVYRFFTAAIRSLSIDEFYDKVNIIFPNNSNEPAVIECYNGIYAKLLTAIDDIDTYIKDYESNIPSNYSVFDLYGFLNNSEENKTASAYEKKYMHMVSNYRSRRDIVLNKSFKALFNNKDRKKAGMLKNLCRLGFSIFNVFGGDMYRTYLAAKPQFTGAYRWLVQILSDNHITDECVHKFINHDNLNITYVLPSKLYAFNKVDNFVLRNYFPAHDLAGNALDIFLKMFLLITVPVSDALQPSMHQQRLNLTIKPCFLLWLIILEKPTSSLQNISHGLLAGLMR